MPVGDAAITAAGAAAPAACGEPGQAPGGLSGRPVFLLSGQGAQKPGMGADLMDGPQVAEAFACASEVLGFDLAAFVADATQEQMNRTDVAQAALCAMSVGLAGALDARGVRPAAVLGFSLGQVSALAVSGMLGMRDAFELVAVRGRLMDEAAHAHPGCMSALLKAEEDEVRVICAECARGEVLAAANYNCPGQIVVSGTVGAVERAERAWAARGRRFARLATAGAFHSPLMAQAAEQLGQYLHGVRFGEPQVPVICNTDARPLSAAEAPQRLARHLTSPVRFQQSVEGLIAQGADTFVEVGFGGVLVNLVRRIDRSTARALVQDAPSLAAFAEKENA